jgi:hypothetical protein
MTQKFDLGSVYFRDFREYISGSCVDSFKQC